MKNFNLKSILATILLLLGVSQTMWGTTVYYVISESDRNEYTVKCNTNHKGDGEDWHIYDMTNTGKTYNGNPIWSCSFTETYGGLGCIQFQLYEGSTYIGEDQPFGTKVWTSSSTYSEKMWVHGSSEWMSYTEDGGSGSSQQFNSVGLIGTINGSGNWNDESYELTYADGVWSIEIKFTGGANQFKARANDKWDISFGNGSNDYSETLTGLYRISIADGASNGTSLTVEKISASTFTVTFDANGHGTAPAKQSVTSGGKATEPTPAPTATGYTFGGWYTEAACTNKYNFTTTTVTKDITLYAKWTAAVAITSYTVVGSSGTVFGTANCPTCTANNMVKQADGTYVLKKSITNLSANKRDYYIVGNHDGNVWRYPASGTLTYENTVAGDYDITFTLDLSTDPVTVSCTMVKAVSSTNFYYYDEKGEWKDANCVPFTKEAEFAYATLTNYKSGNQFKIFDGNTKEAENWWGNNKDNNHTVACAPHIDNSLGNIELGKAGSGDYDNAKFSASSISTGTFYVILYYPNTESNTTSNYKLCASTTLPDASNYTVSFNYNGGSGTTPSLSCDKGGNITLPTPNTREGYTFNGWYTTTTGGTLAGAAGESYTPAGSLTLYAQWLKDDYSADTYYYFDDKITKWDGSVGVEMVKAAEYAFIQRPAYNNTDNKFKIFPTNPKGADNTKIANGENIAPEESPLKGDIKLTAEGGDYNNIKIEATTSDYFVILYYPNTATNPSNQFLVAASYSLPNAEKYNVNFGVVGETGGTLTAKSGSSTISSGALVSFATFTATPDVGYAVEGWYSDAKGTNRISAAGTKTTYSQAITEANHTIYVKFTQVRSVYFKNNHNWDEVHIYTFSNNPFNGDYNGEDGNTRDDAHKKGIGPAGALEKAKMENMGNGIYAYQLTNATAFQYIAFTSKEQYSYDNFFEYNNVVYRKDHNDATGLSMYIPNKSESASWVNKNGDNHANYFYNGVWMKPYSTDAGYEIAIRTGNAATLNYAYFRTTAVGGFDFSYDTVLTAGTTYRFFVKNDNNNYFGRGTDAGNAILGTTNNLEMYLWGSGEVSEVYFTPVRTGTYTFTLHLGDGKVLVDVLYPEDKYRLVYVEKDASSNIVKFHPSHDIKQNHGATKEEPARDTVSMHVRPKVLPDTTANPNTCQIVLQTFDIDTQKWTDTHTIDVKNGNFSNGVYNFIVKQDGFTVSIDEENIKPYTGRYYIRTDASKGGWNNYKQLKNYCYYSEYSRVYRGFDYYYCHWTEAGKNIKYTIACDYSYCVSDTLAQEDHDPHKGFTEPNGKFLQNANIRFMWNSFDNTLDRAYIAGRGDNIYLLSESGIYNTDGTTLAKEVKLDDQENWVYRADVMATPNARIKLRVLPYNNAGFYSWFRGKDGNYSEANTEQLIAGKSGNKYRIRVIYDFKTDHLICAWIPDGQITEDDIINADLMIIRKDQGDATQLKFDPSNRELTSVTTAFGVITMTKEHLEGGKDKSLAPQERGCFWVSFPFDVRLSDVFGCGTYGVDFIIQYYDGESRAKNGCWIDSPTYWRYVEDPTNFTLKKGKGYILVVDYVKILDEQFQHGNTEVSIYFPSANETSMDITGELPTEVVIPPHKCEIQRENRYIYDSNWNLIGVPSWANIDEFGNPRTAYQVPDVEQKFYIGFFYDYNAKTKKWNTSLVNDTTFKSMHAYLVQWAGTINWKDKSVTGGVYEGESPAQQALQARRYAPAAEGEEEAEGAGSPEQYTLRLTLNRGEQQLDHTYVRLQEGNVTTDFDLNYDMTKILNDGTNLYSLVGTNLIQCAANVQPLQEDAQTISIPLGVVADQDGLYTFSLPEGTEGMNVSLVDNESGTVYNLSLGDYQTALTAGTYEQRFALEIQPRQEVSTGCEQTDAAGKSLRKVLIDGNLYILRDGKAYTAAGQEL